MAILIDFYKMNECDHFVEIKFCYAAKQDNYGIILIHKEDYLWEITDCAWKHYIGLNNEQFENPPKNFPPEGSNLVGRGIGWALKQVRSGDPIPDKFIFAA